MSEKNIAIVGIACRFPDAKNKEEFWHNLANGTNSVKKIPANRWDTDLHARNIEERNRAAVQWMASIDDADCFDRQFFGIAPIDAQGMDPQQRLMIEMGWHCFEDAGMNIDTLPTRNIGVYLAGFNYDYKQLQDRNEQDLGTQYTTGAAGGIMASQVSYHLNLQGPSFVLDAACSGTLEALNSAILAIEAGSCEMALVGGICLIFTETRHATFAQTGMLSNKGQCSTFDDKADGYVRGEGGGIILLKSADKAIEDDDHIYGIIKGCKTNHTGMQPESKSISYPISSSQAGVIADAHIQAGFPAESISFVETHGTGTPKGDPMEIEGLKNAFEQISKANGKTDETAFCRLGAVKANVGHLESAAGFVGLVKTLMCLEHRQIPPLCGFKTLNKKIQLDGSPFVIADQLQDWTTLNDKNGKPYPRRAGVSSFGFGGTNAHLAIEESPTVNEANTGATISKPLPAYLLVLSAKTERALIERREQLISWLDINRSTNLSSLSRTLLTGRAHFARREAYVINSLDDALEKMRKVLSIGDVDDFFYGEAPVEKNNQEQAAAVKKSTILIEQLGAKKRPAKTAYITKLRQLAEAYTVGLDLDWQSLFKHRPAKALQLPGYPFAKTRCWLADGEGHDGRVGRLHPLLHANTSTAAEPRFSSVFNKGEANATDYPEMASVAIAQMMGLASEDQSIVFTEFTSYLPLPADGKTAMHIGIYPQVKEQCSFSIYSLSTNGTESETIYCEGEAVFGTTQSPLLETEAIHAQCQTLVRSENKDRGAILFAPIWQPVPITTETLEVPNPGQQNDDRRIVTLIELPEDHQKAIANKVGQANCHFLNVDTNTENTALSIAESFQFYTATLLSRNQTLIEEMQQSGKGKVLFQVVIPSTNTDQQCLINGLLGMLKTVQKEHSRILSQLINIEANTPPVLLADLLDENAQQPRDQHIRYLSNERQVDQWSEITSWNTTHLDSEKDSKKTTESSPWKNQGVYIITGGAGELGLMFAKEIAQTVESPILILTGRREQSASHNNAIEDLQKLGATAHYHSVDVAAKAPVDHLVEEVKSQYGKLNGIIHCAGVIRDSLIVNKTSEELQQVLNPKVAGVLNLDNATQAIELDFFICFSSTSGALGNIGQADYAAANAFMDSFVNYRHQLTTEGKRHGLSLSLNWPLWRDGGMSVDSATEESMRQQFGAVPLETSTGFNAFYKAVASELNQVLIVEGDVEKIRRKILTGDSHAKVAESQLLGLETMQPKVLKFLTQSAANTLGAEEGAINSLDKFNEYGFTSVLLVRMANSLNSTLEIDLTAALFFEYNNIDVLTEYLLEEYPAEMLAFFAVSSAPTEGEQKGEQERQTSPDVSKRQQHLSKRQTQPTTNRPDITQDPIAVIGMSCRFPMAPDIETLQKNLELGKDCISKVPRLRWDWREYDGDPTDDGKKTQVSTGGFIDNVDHFDPLFFNISPREAEGMDPQQRALMMEIWKAIESAGIAPSSLAGSNTAIYIGNGASDYSSLFVMEEIDGYAATNRSPSIGPNRMSFFLDVHGSSEPTDTGCSSSIIAIHNATADILSGKSDIAIAGGTHANLIPEAYIARDKSGMLSKTGYCHTFSANADGFIPGEGVGILLLKRLSAAERDGDPIHAVICGVGKQHGGSANSLTAPNPVQQAALIQTTYTEAGINPTQIGAIETHGTGTPLGDPVEINGLKRGFKVLYKEQGVDQVLPHCGLSSIKSNIGHAEYAAGVAGVIKMILQLKQKTLYPSLHCEPLNPEIRINKSPFYIVKETQDWVAPVNAQDNELPRIGGVSSFGFGGANSHIILKEYIPKQSPQKSIGITSQAPAVIVLSAKNQERLREQAQNLLAKAQTLSDEQLADMAYTLQIGRDQMAARLGVVVCSVDELKEKLQAFLNAQLPITNLYHGQTDDATNLNPEKLPSLQSLIEQGEYAKFVELWTKGGIQAQGATLDWMPLYPDKKPKRIDLPTYAFAKESYWITPTPQVRQTIPIVESALSSSLEGTNANAGDTAGKIETLHLQPQWQAQEVAPDLPEIAYHHHMVVLCESDPMWEKESNEFTIDTTHFLKLTSEQPEIGQRYTEYAGQIFARIQSFLQQHPKDKTLLQIVIPNLGEQQLLAGLSGLLISAEKENPNFTGQLIATNTASNANNAEDLFSRLLQQLIANTLCPATQRVEYRDGKRWELNWKERRGDKTEVSAETHKKIPFKDGGTYLITGGAGGLALIFAKEITKKVSAPILILTGRSALSQEKTDQLQTLTGLGAKVHYMQVDISQPQAVKDLIDTIQKEHGNLSGIIHSAGVIHDNYIVNKPLEELQTVFAPKVAGTINLDIATKGLPLDFMILFSSATAVLGNLGQVDYAGANAFMDAFARYRNTLLGKHRHGQTLSINWPLWREGGMQIDASAKDTLLQTMGIVPMETDIGIEALYHSLATGADQVLVLVGERAKIQQHLSAQTIETKFGLSVLPSNEVTAESVHNRAPSEVPQNADNDDLHKQVTAVLTEKVAAITKLDAGKISPKQSLNDYGLDSIGSTKLCKQLNADYSLDLIPTVVYTYPNIEELSQHLVDDYYEQIAAHFSIVQPTKAATIKPASLAVVREKVYQSRPKAIAVIGMSGQFPMAEDIQALWNNLLNGQDCITEVPKSRWDYKAIYGDPSKDGDFCDAKYGGFISDIAAFDAAFFGISPREAKLMCPHQRLILTYVWKTLEDAGYAAKNLAGSDTAIFVGTMGSGYLDLVKKSKMPLEGYTATGAALSVGPNRTSFFMDFHGPSEPVDTACSSSLVAVHRAIDAIKSGQSHVAVAGGINTLLSPEFQISLSKAGMLCPDGRCKTFSDRANGYVRSEGIGLVMLKDLSAAERDGDHIYGVIHGSAENHGGQSNSLTAPNPKSQAELIVAAHTQAGFDPSTISYIEAHGTGTNLGDPVEIEGLQRAFKELSNRSERTEQNHKTCGIGSIKSNIGHLEHAAGIAGLIKVLLQLKHKTLVKSLHTETLNPYLQLERSPFYIMQEAKHWEAIKDANGKKLPRRAAVSSFGFGGVNSHVVVEEYIAPPQSQAPILFDQQQPVIVLLSAKNQERLKQQAHNLATVITEQALPETALADLAYTLQIGREPMVARIALLVTSMDALKQKLEAFIKGQSRIEGVYQSPTKPNNAMVALDDDEDMAKTLQAWINKGKYSKVLELWVQGLVFDWAQLYTIEHLNGSSKPKRISLPSYPFAKDHHWVKTSPAGIHTTTNNHAAILHPLLHQNTSTLYQQRYRCDFNGEEFFLADHIVNGEKVLPGVAYLEMAREAVAQAAELGKDNASVSVELSNVVWVRPIIARTIPTRVQINLNPQDDKNIAYEIYSETDEQGKIIHGQGLATLAQSTTVPGLDLASIRDNCQKQQLSAQQHHGALEHMGFTVGPSFKGMEAVWIGEGQVLSKFKLPESVAHTLDNHQGYMLHPNQMDCALQSAVGLLFAGEIPTVPQLPFALDKLRIFHPCTREMWAWVRDRKTNSADSPNASNTTMQYADIDICDNEGKVCIQLNGVTTRALKTELPQKESVKKEKSRGLMLQPHWQEQGIEADTPTATFSEHYIVLCETANDLEEQISNALVVHTTTDTHNNDATTVHYLTLQDQHSAIEHRYTDYCAQIMEQLQTIMRSKPKAPVLFQVVMPHNTKAQTSLFAGMGGLLKAAQLENPKLITQLIALDSETSASIATDCILENRNGADQNTSMQSIRYQDGKRYLAQWLEVEDALPQISDQSTPPWQDNAVYLISGGAGGLGLLVAQDIAQKTKHTTLVLTGRSELSEQKAAKLNILNTNHTKVDYRQVDVTKKAAVKALIDTVQTDYGQLNGIIHSAGIIQDNFILKKNQDELFNVFDPKVTGLINLDQATQNIKLDFIVLFSSLAAVLGNTGQADYAAANAFMDAYAHYRNGLVKAGQRHGHTVSINWPLWQSGGMAMDAASEQVMQQNTGMVPMTTATGLQALYQAIKQNGDQYVVMEGDPSRMRFTLLMESSTQPTPQSTPVQEAPTQEPVNASNPMDSHGQRGAKNVATPDLNLDSVANYLKELLASVIDIPAQDIDPDQPMEQYGIDSIMVVRLTNQLESIFGSLSKTLFFEYQTLTELSEYFLQEHAQQLADLITTNSPKQTEIGVKPIAAEQANSQPIVLPSRFLQPDNTTPHHLKNQQTPAKVSQDIAIIGLAGRYPGADNLDAFWLNLQQGVDAIGEIPSERWDHSRYFDEDKDKEGKTYCKWGGFINGVDEFDPLYFNIAPREAELMEPQERLFLQCAVQTIQDAGYTPATLTSKPKNNGKANEVGVFVGAGYQEYQFYGIEQTLLGNPISIWSSHASVANRVSYFCNFGGPSFTVDTMCSSSLMAIHLACRSLLNQECGVALAGGINISIHPSKHLLLGDRQFVSSTGRCHSFGSDGDGYVSSEGLGAVLLKPLSRAQADRDHVYGVIKSSAINHGGKTNGYTVPNPNAQAEVITQALERADINPRTISYLEAHGTGTSLGDPIEITGLNKSFRKFTQDDQFCAIGSVKSNIGHAEAAAGIAGLSKVLLQLKHQQLVPSLHSQKLSPNINFETCPFVVQQQLTEWVPPEVEIDGVTRQYPLRAGISSFGAGGANGHIIIEEYQPTTTHPETEHQGPVLIPLSAKNPQRLRDTAQDLAKFLRNNPTVNLLNLAYTLQVGRDALEQRLAVVTDSVTDLVNTLSHHLKNVDQENNNVPDHLYQTKGKAQAKQIKDALAMFTRDDTVKASLDAWLQEKNYHKLAELWTQGLNIDWPVLYTDVLPHRISLPTYPFAREHYWIAQFRQQPPLNANREKGNGESKQSFDTAFYDQVLDEVMTNTTSIESAVTQITAQMSKTPG
jgi:acyl transferase domain-containing protein/acyl carrier protein